MEHTTLKLSSAQLPVTRHGSFKSWAEEMAAWADEAAERGSRLMLFPEFGSLSLASLLDPAQTKNPDEMLLALQTFLPDFQKVFQDLATKHKAVIVASSFITQDAGALYNRAFVYNPAGLMGHQDKVILTRFEREKTSIKAGTSVRTFEAEFGRFAVAICFDSEFPLVIRQVVEADAKLILVPSCTGSLTGFYRVKIGCQARALENQIPVVQSVTVGDALWQPIADTNHGAAALYAPPDNGFPADGVLAIGEIDKPSWLHTEVDFAAFANIRRNGHVLNWSYWDEQKNVSYAA
jgi:predicted amidohydrolase